jgi:acylphosphatase
VAALLRCKTLGMTAQHAIRATARGKVQGVGFRDATVRHAHGLGLLGWVRNGEDGEVLVHAEGPGEAVAALEAFLRDGPPAADVDEVTIERVKPEGHEQFAIRGVSAGAFVVCEHSRGFELQLEVAGATRAWSVPKGPSTDPAVKGFAIELPAGTPPADGSVWDHGSYEQGGRVPWPEALERGHAVFVLHGEKLRGGCALQRTGAARWLLVKRRDEHAAPASASPPVS